MAMHPWLLAVGIGLSLATRVRIRRDKSAARMSGGAKKAASMIGGEINAGFGVDNQAIHGQGAVRVHTEDFYRAETDRYFSRYVRLGYFGHWLHRRVPIIAGQDHIPRMQQDTLFSITVVDLQAGPVTITLPDGGRRFQSLMPLSQDHDSYPCEYGPGSFVYYQEFIGTRYMAFIVRTFMNANDEADIAAARALQDLVGIGQDGEGVWEIPDWNQDDLTRIRAAATELFLSSRVAPSDVIGLRKDADPLSHLMIVAVGWGGNGKQDAVYLTPQLQTNDGTDSHTVTIRDVPLRDGGFWSITVYGPDGFLVPNGQGINSFNSESAQFDPDGSATINFGGCEDCAWLAPHSGLNDTGFGDPRSPCKINCIPVVARWQFCIRMYLPEASILNGEWTFPDVLPVPSS